MQARDIGIDVGPVTLAIEELAPVLGDRLSTAQSVRDQHGRDESYHASLPPDAFAFVETT